MATRTPAPLILPLDAPSADLALVGGKGASLARLAAAGLPVPPGFHVTTEAYRRFVSEGGVLDPLLAAASAATPGRPDTCDEAALQIDRLFASRPLPAAIDSAIRAATTAMAPVPPSVAVRSSATAEDLPELSFAGQQDSYLNLRGEDAVVAAVKRCWASLWTARAIAYRARHGIPSEDVAMAVLVQQLVCADAAGVLFTADPVTGARDQLHIDASWGLGEAVVSGQVTPDTLVLDKATRAVLRRQLGDKAVMTVLGPHGTRTEPVPAERRGAPVLDAAEAAELAGIGVPRIEALYGRPMDIEWARAEGRFFILQARPMTAVPAPTVRS